jgi:hypothetical protein
MIKFRGEPYTSVPGSRKNASLLPGGNRQRTNSAFVYYDLYIEALCKEV